MANVLDLKRRIRSVKNTRQITKAMKMVSAAKLRRAQERAIAARPYAQMLSSVLASLMRRIDLYDPQTGELRHPLLVSRPEKRIALVVLTGDKGFAGAFNVNVLKAALRFMDDPQTSKLEIDVEVIGRKGRDFLRRRFQAVSFVDHAHPEHATQERQRAARIEITGEYTGFLEKPHFDNIARFSRELINRYITREVDAVYLVFNEFQSVISQRIVVERVLPIKEIGKHDVAVSMEMDQTERERMAEAAHSSQVSIRAADTREADEEASKFGTAQVDYIYEQPPRELLSALLPHYVYVQFYHAMLESVAAEHAARMTAMDSASNNASEMIDALTLKMNRVRQAAITKEIIEIVSGAAAL
ncbi:MAG TPA: FoF1 ATP synthase subunit gamma [Acidobacteriaceae bacterium]|jgi:F-type H+-transporting ATPase subunit gamma|nr:FoF1 ATP synthase subunit gamma [Acidobacteriaceae bacterium]